MILAILGIDYCQGNLFGFFYVNFLKSYMAIFNYSENNDIFVKLYYIVIFKDKNRKTVEDSYLILRLNWIGYKA